MGYTTDFEGSITIEPALTPEQVAYLQRFNRTRRMLRDAAVAELLDDPVREAVGLPIGTDGAYYVGSNPNNFGQDRDESIIMYNDPPGAEIAEYRDAQGRKSPDGEPPYSRVVLRHGIADCQPNLWCQWTVNDDGTELMWDGGEKFYSYTEWMAYLINHFFAPWNRELNGTIFWQGEEPEDTGIIEVKANRVYRREGRVSFGPAVRVG